MFVYHIGHLLRKKHSMEKIPLILLVTTFHFYLFVGILAKRRETIVTMFHAPPFTKCTGLSPVICSVSLNFGNLFVLIVETLVTYFPRNVIAFIIAISWMNKIGILIFVERSIDSKSYINLNIVKYFRFLNRFIEKYYLSAILYSITCFTVEPSLLFEHAYTQFIAMKHIVRMNETSKRVNSDYFVPYNMYTVIQSSHWVCLFYGIYLLGKCYEKSGIEYDILALLFNLLCCVIYVYAAYLIYVLFEIRDMVDVTIVVIFSLVLIFIAVLIMYQFRSVSGRIFFFGCAMFFTNYLVQEIHRYHESNTYEMRVISSANLILLAYITNYISLDHTYGFPLNLKGYGVFDSILMKRLQMHLILFVVGPLRLYKIDVIFKAWRRILGLRKHLPNQIHFLVVMIIRSSIFHFYCRHSWPTHLYNCALLKQKWEGAGVFWQLSSSWFLFMIYVILTIKIGIDCNFVLLDVFAIEIGILTLQLSFAHQTDRQMFSVWLEMKKLYYEIKNTFKGKNYVHFNFFV